MEPITTATTAAPDLFSMLISPWNVLLMVAVWTIIQVARRLMPLPFTKGQPFAKLLPIAPIAMCQAAMWIPGPWMTGAETLGQKLVLGTVIGACTSNLHSILSKVGLQGILKVDVQH
jgi:hypothetical protein